MVVGFIKTSRAVFQLLLPYSILDYWTTCMCKSRGTPEEEAQGTAPVMRRAGRSQPVAQFSRLLVSFFIFSIVLVLGQGHQETSWVGFCPCLICADWKKRKLQGVLSTYTNSTTNILPWSQQGLDRPTVFNQGNRLLSEKKSRLMSRWLFSFFFLYNTAKKDAVLIRASIIKDEEPAKFNGKERK